MAAAVSGPAVFEHMHSYHTVSICRSVNEILSYFGKEEITGSFDNVSSVSVEDFLKEQLADKELEFRSVRLKPDWENNGIEPFLAKRRSDGSYVALVPSGLGHYVYRDLNGKTQRVTREFANSL